MVISTRLILAGFASLFVGAACSDDADTSAAASSTTAVSSTTATGTASSAASSGSGGGGGSSACSGPLATSRTGNSSACAGGNTHEWPVGLKATDCHGWRDVDANGKEHDNSANALMCNADGSVSFVQFADSLDCKEVVGAGVPKTFKIGVCEQDLPPTLYTTGIDTTCCTTPDAPECKHGIPSANSGTATIYLNGAVCTP